LKLNVTELPGLSEKSKMAIDREVLYESNSDGIMFLFMFYRMAEVQTDGYTIYLREAFWLDGKKCRWLHNVFK